MDKRIAVSDSLSPVKRILTRNGYEVVNLENDAAMSEKGMEDYDAVVISGMDENRMGMQDISGKAVVINAQGREPEEILDELRSRL